MMYTDCNGLEAATELEEMVKQGKLIPLWYYLQRFPDFRYFVLLRSGKRLNGTLSVRNRCAQIFLEQTDAAGMKTEFSFYGSEVEMLARCLSAEEIAAKNAAARPCLDVQVPSFP